MSINRFMDKPQKYVRKRFLSRISIVLCLAYFNSLVSASSPPSITTFFSSDDPFYQVTLYRENYILAYHYMMQKRKPRPVTWVRAKPIFQSKIKARRAEETLQTQSNSLLHPESGFQRGHRRELSANPNRRGVLLADAVTLELRTQIKETGSHKPADYNSSTLQRTETHAATIFKNRLEAMRKLEGELKITSDPEEKQQVEAKIDKQIEDTEDDLLELLRQLSEEFFARPHFRYLKHYEVAFQISLKVPLLRIVPTDTRFYLAYTQQSWWQTYTKVSAFFRESNYIPEFFLEQPFKIRASGVPQIESIKVSLIHQSNGEGMFYERSWNRISAAISIRWGLFRMAIEPWYILHTRDKMIYNPDVADHLGYWRASLAFEHSLLRWRIQIHKSSVQLLGSVPLTPSLNLTFYFFNGKGSSLGLYNESNINFGIGIGARSDVC
jgi:outer membrane phospholipase A